jgi:hypothetical protein
MDINIQEDVTGEKPMLTFDKEVVRKMLLEDGYKEKDVEIKLAALAKNDARLQPVLNAYLLNRTISPYFNVDGLTMKIIMEKYSCNFWNALDYMEYYLKHPERAKILIEAPRATVGKNAPEKAKEEKQMLTFDKEVVRKMLLEDGYEEKDVEIKLAALAKTDARLQPVLDAYLVDRTISPDFNVNGLTMKIIMEKYSCNFWNAIDSMEYYLKHPERAKILIEAPPFRYGGRPS